MARHSTAKDREHHQNLIEAARVLRDHGRDQLADSVDHVLSPQGWGMLGRLRADDKGGSLPDNLPIGMQRAVKEHIKAAAAAAGDDLTGVVEEGLTAFVDGTFRPGKPRRGAFGSGDRVNLNLRPNAEVRARAEAVAEELAEELGWKPAVSTLALLWLLERYPLPQETPAAE